ncbi:hypothetical protein [Nonomuraea sp. B1E8]
MTTTLDRTDRHVTGHAMATWTEAEDLVRIEDLDRPAPGFYALPSYTG